MTVCGYNDKMGNGLRLLVEGMIDALERKSESISIDELLRREGVELSVIIETLSSVEDDVNAEMFIGLNTLARGLFRKVQDLQSFAAERWSDNCERINEQFVALLADTEKHSERLKAEYPNERPERIAKQVAEWFAQQSASLARAASAVEG